MGKRVVIITGATGNIGKGLSLRFAEGGYRVGILFHHNHAAAEALAEKLRKKGSEAFSVQTDVRSPESLTAASRTFLKLWSRVDILICSAGIRRDSLLIRSREADWDETMDVNLKGVWNSLRAFGPGLLASDKGQALVIGSAAGTHGRRGQAAYTASKAGLTGLVRSASREWAGDRTRINLVFPGFIPGGISEGLNLQEQTAVQKEQLLEKSPSVSELADTIFRISEISTITGQTFNLDSRIF